MYLNSRIPLFRYFGGTLDLKSLEGWGEPQCWPALELFADASLGSDVFLKLRCLDESI